MMKNFRVAAGTGSGGSRKREAKTPSELNADETTNSLLFMTVLGSMDPQASVNRGTKSNGTSSAQRAMSTPYALSPGTTLSPLAHFICNKPDPVGSARL